mgnify:CR=1 FL=1
MHSQKYEMRMLLVKCLKCGKHLRILVEEHAEVFDCPECKHRDMDIKTAVKRQDEDWG